MADRNEPDDIQKLLNVLGTLADSVSSMTDAEVAEELADLEPMVPSVGEIIEQALARNVTNE